MTEITQMIKEYQKTFKDYEKEYDGLSEDEVDIEIGDYAESVLLSYTITEIEDILRQMMIKNLKNRRLKRIKKVR